jgi:hypothetical protein
MDEVLHDERLSGRARRLHRRAIDALPDGQPQLQRIAGLEVMAYVFAILGIEGREHYGNASFIGIARRSRS